MLPVDVAVVGPRRLLVLPSTALVSNVMFILPLPLDGGVTRMLYVVPLPLTNKLAVEGVMVKSLVDKPVTDSLNVNVMSNVPPVTVAAGCPDQTAVGAVATGVTGIL